MKHNYLTITVMLLISLLNMVSCSQDDQLVSNINDGASIIQYGATLKGSINTRAIPTTSTNYMQQVKDFQVWARNTDEYGDPTDYYIGDGSGVGTIIVGDGKGVWSYKNSADIKYWPNDGKSMSFFAVTPALNENYSVSNDTLTYTIPTDINKQVDFMLDTEIASKKNGRVDFNFKHGLSQIKFKGRVDQTVRGLDVFVKSITIHNLKNKVKTGICDYPQYVTSNSIDTYSNYTINFSSPIEINNNHSYIDLADGNNVLMVAPQEPIRWSYNTSTTQADANHQSYIEIECKVKQNGSYIKGSDSQYAKIYNVFSSSKLEAGKCYTYNMVFDGAGREGLSEISYSVETTDWQEENMSNPSTLNAVDLGLPSGTLWANVDLGASTYTDHGYKFAWGETTPKSTFTQDNYSLYDSETGEYLKYDVTDEISQFKQEDDAAYLFWGKGWSTPSYQQYKELIDNCTFTPVTVNVNGKNVNLTKATSKKNSNFIYFIESEYWTSSYGGTAAISEAWNFWPETPDLETDGGREDGLSIRPVYKP